MWEGAFVHARAPSGANLFSLSGWLRLRMLPGGDGRWQRLWLWPWAIGAGLPFRWRRAIAVASASAIQQRRAHDVTRRYAVDVNQARERRDAEERECQRDVNLEQQRHASHQGDIRLQRQHAANPRPDRDAVLVGAMQQAVAEREGQTQRDDEPEQPIGHVVREVRVLAYTRIGDAPVEQDRDARQSDQSAQ